MEKKINQSWSIRGIGVWGICTLFFLYEFFLRTAMGTYQQPFMEELGLSFLQFSLLSNTLFMLVYSVMQIPCGLVIDRLGLKPSLGIGTLLCALASIGFANAQNYPTAIAFRIIMGLGASFGWVGLLASVRSWIPRGHRGLIMGISQFLGTFGPMAAAGPLSHVTQELNLDWRFLFHILSGIGLSLFLMVILWVRAPIKRKKKVPIRRPLFDFLGTALRHLITQPCTWYVGGVSAGIYFSLEYLAANEGRTFLMMKGTDFATASYLITLGWLGYAIGCPAWGLISDAIGRRKPILCGSSALGFLTLLGLLYSDNLLILGASFVGLGLSAGGGMLGFMIAAEQTEEEFTGVALGMNNALIGILSTINGPLMGWILDLKRQDHALTLQDYLHVLIALPALTVIALICSLLIAELNNNDDEDDTEGSELDTTPSST